MTDAEEAYVAACEAIAAAIETGAETLFLRGGKFQALTSIPPEIARIGKLRGLFLDDTQISDLAPLAELTIFEELSLEHSNAPTGVAPV